MPHSGDRNQQRAEENVGGYQEPQAYIACILGRAQAPLSNRHFKKVSREINAIRDHPKSTRTVGTIPLLCTPTINNIAITKTLLDGGAGLNVISVETFEKLQVPYERLAPMRPFTSITDGTTVPLG